MWVFTENVLALLENKLIAMLPRKDRMQMTRGFQSVPLSLGEVLCEPGERTRHVYFPTEGFISLLTQTDGTLSLEVGMVGNEGMTGAHIALDVATAPLRSLVQGSGLALRMSSARFRTELAGSSALRGVMNRYMYVLTSQMSVSAACLRFHQIGPRLARWLLMSQDRAHADAFAVTQEFLAYMLGVRRVGITQAARVLQRKGLIEYRRGNLLVTDRKGLESEACSCYAAGLSVYAKVLR
jgi:CRP-like cAMP-binding protein